MLTAEQREEFNKLKKEATDLVAKAQAEKRGLTAEEKTANDQRFARCDAIKAMQVEDTRFAKLELGEDFTSALDAAAQLAGANNPGNGGKGKGKGEDAGEQRFDGKGSYTKPFRDFVNEYIRTGSFRQEFALTSGSANGVLLPQIPAQPVVIRRLNNSFIAALLSRGSQPLYTSGTETVPVPIFDDTANVGTNTTAEDATTEDLQDMSTSSFNLGAVLYDSKAMWLSNTLLNGVPYDILGYVEPILQKRIDLKQDAVWTAKVTAAAAAASIAVTTATHAAGVTYQDLLNWQVALPAAYRSDQVFLISDTLFTAMRGLVDSLGRPLYQESLIDGEPDKLFGKPAFISPSLATVAANAYTGITMSAEAIKVRLCTNRRLARYVNIPSHPDQFGMQMFVNGDFNFVSTGTAALKMGAS